MAFSYRKNVNNVYCIDTMFFGFPRFNSAYLVKGAEKTALVDTGDSNSLQHVRGELAKLGVTMQDIDYIFVTHCEHPDHSGNVGYLAKENPDCRIVCTPIGVEYLTKPEIEAAKRKAVLPEGVDDKGAKILMAARFGRMEPVDEAQIHVVKDGEQFNLGGGEILTCHYAPGHQPSGMVIRESLNNGLFIMDLVGQWFAEFDAGFILTPHRSNIAQYIEHLSKYADEGFEHLYMGHYGINDNPPMVIQGALSRMQRLLDMCEKLDREGRLDELKSFYMENIIAPEMDKMRRLREESFYLYYKYELGPNFCNGLAAFYEEYRKTKH